MYTSDYFTFRTRSIAIRSAHEQNLKANPDGSIDICIQKNSPGANKESNWLPAPSVIFILMLRLYWPNESDPSILNGTWTIAAVKKA